MNENCKKWFSPPRKPLMHHVWVSDIYPILTLKEDHKLSGSAYNTIQYGRPSKLDRGADFPFFCGTATVLTIQLSLQHTRDATPDLM